LGHTLSGFYDVKGDGGNQIDVIYCDFDKVSNEMDYETRYGYVDVKSSPVHFFVTRNSSWSTVGTLIPFEKEYLNLGGGMNLTSGEFTAPKAGVYAFSFIASGYGTSSVYSYGGRGDVRLLRNNIYVAAGCSIIYGATSKSKSPVSVEATLQLNKGDTISIYFWGDEIYSDEYNWTQFTGSLLEENLVIS